jgi:hypothetical protein
MSVELQGTLIVLTYIVITVGVGGLIGIRAGHSICNRARIPEHSNSYKSIMVICIVIGGSLGPLSGLLCLLTSGPT